MKQIRKQIGRTVLAGVTACMMGFSGIGVMAEETEQPSPESGKDETVYVITDASGEKQSVIVSDHLKTEGETGTVIDETNLKDIKNVAGDETFQKNADGTITWKADGKDIYYQGTSEGELPVSVKISYSLDGKPVSAKEIAGKAGHVVVRFDYTNDTSETITVNGREETVSVPFAMITGAEIDQERFSNIRVTNGKLISEGSSSFLVGIVFPGLRESLGTDELSEKVKTAEIPDYIEFEADTTGFELGMTMTVAGNNLLKDLSFDTDTDLSDLSGKMGQLTDAAEQLSSGTQELRSGTEQLHEGTGKLKDGASQLKDGTAKVKDGSGQLDDGAGKLADGTAALKDGAGELADGAGTLADGAETISGGAKQLDAGAASLAEGTSDLKNGTASLKEGTAALAEGAAELKNGTSQAVTGADQLAAGAKSAADGAAQLQAGVLRLKNGIEQPAAEGMPSLKDGAAAMSTQIGQSITELQTQKQGLEALKKNVFTSVGETQDNSNDLILAQQYQNVINAAQALGQAQAQAEAAGKQTMMQKTIDRQNETISDLKEENKELKEQNAAEETKSEDSDGQQTAMQETIDRQNETISGQQETINALQEENRELKEQNLSAGSESENTAETADNDADAELQATISELQGQLDAADTENGELQSRIDSLQAENDSLKGQLEGSEAEVAALNEQIAALQAENESLKASQESADTAEEHAETTAYVKDAAEAMLVLTGQENAPADVQEAMQNLAEAKAAYNSTVTAMLGSGSGSTNDALIVSQIDAAIAVIDQTIGDDTHGLKALQNGAGSISAGINQLDAGINQLAAGFAGDGTAQNPGLVNGISAVSAGASELASGAKALDAGMTQLKDGIDQVDAGAVSLDEGAAKLDGGAQALKTGLDALSSGTDQAATGADALKQGAEKLSSGASELNTGAETLHAGTGDLKNGTAQLDTGAADLLSGAVQLDNGAAQLDDGAETLLEGMEQFRSEGIDRLAEVFGDELEDVLDRLTAISDAGSSYRSFTGTSSGENDSVKFIFKTESVKAD